MSPKKRKIDEILNFENGNRASKRPRMKPEIGKNYLDENRHEKTKTSTVVLSQKRRRSEISPLENENKASKSPRMEPEIVKNSLENFMINPGLQHLAENIFSNLNYQDITSCQLINQSSRFILNNPGFWLKKFIQKGMSKKNKNDWIKAIQLTKNTNFERNLQLYLKMSLSKGKMFNIPCYIDKNALQKSSDLMKKFGALYIILSQITRKIKCQSDTWFLGS